MAVIKREHSSPCASESEVQDALWKRVGLQKRHPILTPNGHLWAWESDLISVTKAGYAHEYEIKISRADFLAEQRDIAGAGEADWTSVTPKQFRHLALQGRTDHPALHACRRITDARVQECAHGRPSHFWYVTTPGVCDPEEVPAYAGLMVVKDTNARCRVEKDAPAIHRNPLATEGVQRLAYLLTSKYWSTR